MIKKLNDFIHDENLDWEQQESYLPTPSLNRKKINWIPDSVIEECHIMFSSLTEKLNQVFTTSSKFGGISIWKDTTGFYVVKHTDNPVISFAIQIYLVNGPDNFSTVFEYNNEKITPKFKVNNGYLFNNKSKLIHYMDSFIPENFTRYSLYAIWTVD